MPDEASDSSMSHSDRRVISMTRESTAPLNGTIIPLVTLTVVAGGAACDAVKFRGSRYIAFCGSAASVSADRDGTG